MNENQRRQQAVEIERQDLRKKTLKMGEAQKKLEQAEAKKKPRRKQILRSFLRTFFHNERWHIIMAFFSFTFLLSVLNVSLLNLYFIIKQELKKTHDNYFTICEFSQNSSRTSPLVISYV